MSGNRGGPKRRERDRLRAELCSCGDRHRGDGVHALACQTTSRTLAQLRKMAAKRAEKNTPLFAAAPEPEIRFQGKKLDGFWSEPFLQMPVGLTPEAPPKKDLAGALARNPNMFRYPPPAGLTPLPVAKPRAQDAKILFNGQLMQPRAPLTDELLDRLSPFSPAGAARDQALEDLLRLIGVDPLAPETRGAQIQIMFPKTEKLDKAWPGLQADYAQLEIEMMKRMFAAELPKPGLPPEPKHDPAPVALVDRLADTVNAYDATCEPEERAAALGAVIDAAVAICVGVGGASAISFEIQTNALNQAQGEAYRLRSQLAEAQARGPSPQQVCADDEVGQLLSNHEKTIQLLTKQAAELRGAANRLMDLGRRSWTSETITRDTWVSAINACKRAMK